MRGHFKHDIGAIDLGLSRWSGSPLLSVPAGSTKLEAVREVVTAPPATWVNAEIDWSASSTFMAEAFTPRACACVVCSSGNMPQSNGGVVVDNFTALLSNFSWWDQGVTGRGLFLSYSFETAPAAYLSSVYNTTSLATFQAFSDATKVTARAALDAFSAISGVTFLETTSGSGDIAFGAYDLTILDQSTVAGLAYLPQGFSVPTSQIAGDVFLSRSLNTGSAAFGVLLHEIGHALGLKHPFEGNLTLRSDLDNYANTVMSYTSNGGTINGLGPFDVQAIQQLYGNQSAKGNQITSWSWNAALGLLTQTGGAGADSIQGIAAADSISGSAGNDLIFARAGADWISGGDDNDRLDGGIGIDTIFGDLGDDSLVGGEGADSLTGGDGNDRIEGGIGNDRLFGSDGNDNMLGGTGSDFFDGGAGADTISADLGADTIMGGGGDDLMFLDVRQGAIFTIDGGANADVAAIRVFRTDGSSVIEFSLDASIAAGASVINVETASIDCSDQFGGTGLSRVISGYSGADNIFGNIGADTLRGLGGNDNLIGEDGNDSLDGMDGNDTLRGGNGNDLVLGGAGIDFLYGDGGADLLLGGGDGDQIVGGDGDDTINGGAGADSLFGGIGFDFASYANDVAGVTVTVNFSRSVDVGGVMMTEFLAEFEGLIGSAFNDSLTGDGSNNILDGGLGVDVLNGGAGFDFASYANATAGITLFMGGGTFNTGEANGDAHISIEGLIGSSFSDIIGGDAGVNELRGLNGNDFIYGRGGVDTLLGGDGNDVLDGGLGADVLTGGTGLDVAYFRDATSAVTASLLSGGTVGEAAGDTYFEIENIWGSRFDDVLAGDNGSGQVYGFEGNDSLSGLGGDDFFYGGTGSDTIVGGEGADSAFFLSWNDHVNQFGTPEPYEGGDVFTDFTSGTDRVILSRFWFGFGNIGGPAAALTETHANFVTNGNAATGRPSLIWNATARTLSFDADGAGATQAVLMGTFQAGATLTLGDIWTA